MSEQAPPRDVGAVLGVILGVDPDRFDVIRDFYVETLGLPLRTDRPGHINFQWGDIRLTISAHSDVHGLSDESRRTMLNLAVEDIEAVASRLRAAGVTFIREPSAEPWGGSIATFEDPDGNTLQLMQRPPGMG